MESIGLTIRFRAVPYFRRLVAGFLPRRPGFDPGQVMWDFWWTLGQVLSEYFGLPCQSSFNQLLQSRSDWPRGLRHEMSSLARTLGSWVRIPLKVWMSVWEYSVVLFCVFVPILRRADPPSKESYRLCIRNWKGGQGPTKGCRATDRQTDRETDNCSRITIIYHLGLVVQ
jgi:hypothetical protein